MSFLGDMMEGNSMYSNTITSFRGCSSIKYHVQRLASGLSCSQLSVILGTKLFSDESSLLDVEVNIHHPIGPWED